MVADVWMGRMWQLMAVALGCTRGSSVLFGISLALGGLVPLVCRRTLSLWSFCPSSLQGGILGTWLCCSTSSASLGASQSLPSSWQGGWEILWLAEL